jgi:hypothetical protein
LSVEGKIANNFVDVFTGSAGKEGWKESNYRPTAKMRPVQRQAAHHPNGINKSFKCQSRHAMVGTVKQRPGKDNMDLRTASKKRCRPMADAPTHHQCWNNG